MSTSTRELLVTRRADGRFGRVGPGTFGFVKVARGPGGKFAPLPGGRKEQRARAAALRAPAVPEAQNPPRAALRITHIALLLDESGSMTHLARQARHAANERIADLKKQADETGEALRISVFTFSRRWQGEIASVRELAFDAFPQAAPMLNESNYSPNGDTPLLDAVQRVTEQLESIPSRHDQDHAFLLITVTDGEENASVAQPRAVENRLKALQARDNWSFAFAGPRGSRDVITRLFGVPEGNVTEWEATGAGVIALGSATSAGTQSYLRGRAAGKRATKTFYSDLSKVSAGDIATLPDRRDAYQAWAVDGEGDIRVFVEEKLADIASPARRAALRADEGYVAGRAFYELTKPERVQGHKFILVQDKASGRIVGPEGTRALLGLPADGSDIRLKPYDHGHYRVFVGSTSTNRKLVRGTTLLYAKA